MHRFAWKAPLHRIGVLRSTIDSACARTRVPLLTYLHSSITVIRQNQQLLPVAQYFMAKAMPGVPSFLARETRRPLFLHRDDFPQS